MLHFCGAQKKKRFKPINNSTINGMMSKKFDAYGVLMKRDSDDEEDKCSTLCEGIRDEGDFEKGLILPRHFLVNNHHR